MPKYSGSFVGRVMPRATMAVVDTLHHVLDLAEISGLREHVAAVRWRGAGARRS